MSVLLEGASGHKRQRPSNDATDRISNLPESVLSHILSLVPTKDAVATSLLSRRWKFLWTNIHNLIFTDDIPNRSGENSIEDREIRFGHFVNKVLLFLNGQSIDKFSLTTKMDFCEVYDVTTWIAVAVARNVKVLDFVSCYLDRLCIRFPRSFFTCKTLEALSLYSVKVVSIPSLIDLPNLKTLRLEGVHCDESVRKLISGCSSLESLYIDRREDDDAVIFTISSPTLINLTFIYYEECGFADEDLIYKLEINAPSLRYLHLMDHLSGDFSVENLCSLEQAEVLTLFSNCEEDYDLPDIGYDQYSKAVVKLLQGLYNVKHPSLSGDILKVLSDTGLFPGFLRLTRLDVKAEYCGWNSLLDLVKGSNKLQFLTFSHDCPWRMRRTDVTCWSKPEKVPICLSSCLQEMSIDEFEGLECELAMVAYILENAEVLRTMTIKAANTLNYMDKFQLLQKVSMFSRGSKTCKIAFS